MVSFTKFAGNMSMFDELATSILAELSFIDNSEKK